MTASRQTILKALAVGFIATGVPAGAVATEEELGSMAASEFGMRITISGVLPETVLLL